MPTTLRQLGLGLALVFVTVTATFGAAQDPNVKPPEKPRLGIKIDESGIFDNNLPVSTVLAGSTAAAMGVQAGDLLKAINGKPLHALPDLQTQLASIKVGDPLTLDVVRNGEAKQLTGTMQAEASLVGVQGEISKANHELQDIKSALGMNHREASLAELLQMVKEIEERMPLAVAQFKKQYPNGEFKIEIKIEITSDKSAKNPVDLVPPPGAPAPQQAPAPAPPAPAPQAPAPAPQPK